MPIKLKKVKKVQKVKEAKKGPIQPEEKEGFNPDLPLNKQRELK